MKISLNWLKEYIDLKDISVEEIVEKLTSVGIEVEGVEHITYGGNDEVCEKKE